MDAPVKLKPGDRVAVVSPSWAGPGVFPAVQDLALRRIRDELDLEPVEFPTTRTPGASAAERAADLMAAYADPTIRAVFASIGGDDQITVLSHLDPAPFRADPKPYFGYSDNTNLLNWLWTHGVAGYHGGSTLVHLSRPLDPVHLSSLRAALFDTTDLAITPVNQFSEEESDWDNPSTLDTPLATVPSPGWVWHQPGTVVTGPTWGGNLEILHWNLAASRWILPVERYAGSILLLETSEELPPAEEVFRMLRNAGERGLLEQFPAVLVATAKAAFRGNPASAEERSSYRDDQREAVLEALAVYSPSAMAVFGIDFGHTTPQWILPYGGRMTIDGPNRSITAHF
ncbi:S66 peptidase family protein [Paractinoplanes brasiliensis]|uniref:Muramoyltetrapeptide carboxypeptidase LdcA involved in peptidoglycan recycling n=1 Tax=Paractinoplanes brasiliensis TaxID=52695 RepID=A0A4R6JUC1_9ACTN|nr:S66 peptidase family protein [Actinoplanes brasiliensis]TDO39081.1 muramoyltetrapeptide carboxypeptidase LdcA involved in peptidoglycan recycling [Actinoplanes brasiliensis]GID30219.1 LD-carboxypeptidase [Actinoplanes brasiliensis]